MKTSFIRFALFAALPALLDCGTNGGSNPLTEKLNDIGETVAAQCDLKCEGVLKAKGSISTGKPEVDAFFRATANLDVQVSALNGEIERSLDEMAAAIDVNLTGIVGADAKASAIVTGLKSPALQLDGGVKVVYQKPKCEVSAQASIQASAKCDVDVDPGTAEVECHGSCEVQADVTAECDASVSVPKCTGTAPNFQCTGTCSGSCELKAGAKCEGTCKGTCELNADGSCDGECVGGTDSGGKCTGECHAGASGKCSTECKGTCELSAAATCDGECRGECTWDPGTVKCTDGGAKLTCEAKADASVKCNGTCKGDFEPPKVKADCKATAKAEASFKAECTPPSFRLDYKFKAGVTADAKLALQAKFEAFGKAFVKLSAKSAKTDLLISASGDLVGSAQGGLKGTLTGLSGSKTIKDAKGGLCGLAALKDAGEILAGAGNKLQSAASACSKITSEVGSGS